MSIEADKASTRGIPCKIKNHLQQANIFILLSFFDQLSHHIKIHRVDILLYWEFSGVRGGVLQEKVSAIEEAMVWNRGILTKFEKILRTV